MEMASGRNCKWQWQLLFLKKYWQMGKTTMMISANYEKVPREKIKVWFDDLKIYDFTS